MKRLSFFLLLSSVCHGFPHFTLTPKSIHPGEVALIRVTPVKDTSLPADLAVSAASNAVSLWDCPKAKRTRCGLVPVPMEAKHTLPVIVKWTEGDKPKSETLSLRLTEKSYTRTKLKVSPKQTNPDPEDEKRIDRERAEFKEIYGCSDNKPLWTEAFVLPANGSVTSGFGSQRVFNGEVKTVHYGVDLRAGAKTPIKSANAGKVVFAKDAFFGGNTVVIDHGLGIFSSYNHLSVLSVTVGQFVKRGEKLGMAGATGRATGPHLHWGVKVNGLSVDPLQMKRVFGKMWESATAPKRSTPVAVN